MAAAAKQNVLLSGGIGAGKSTVAAMLALRGADVISTDRLGHALFEPDSPVHGRVAARWPTVVADDGSIDRGRLGAIVFDDPGQLAELEAMTHREIRRAATARAESSSADVVVVEVPLRTDFLGPGWRRVVVHAPAAVRTERLIERGLAAGDVAARMAVQPSDAEWQEWADFVVDNSADEEALEAEVERLWRWLRDGSPGPVGRSRLSPRVQ